MGKTDNRISWIDSAKGIGILLVVLGHTYGIPTWLYGLIYSFHMPLFFLLSGMTYRDPSDNLLNGIKHFAKRYLATYFILAFTNLSLHSFWLLLQKKLSTKLLAKYLCGIFYCYASMDWMPNCSPIWFLPCLFVAKVFFLFIGKIRSSKGQFMIILLCVGISSFWAELRLPRLPWNICSAFMAVAFLWLGKQQIRWMNDPLHNKAFKWLMCSCMAATVVLLKKIIENGVNVGMNGNKYGNLWIFGIGAIGLSNIVFIIAKMCLKTNRLFIFLGQSTLLFMGFNYFARSFSTEVYYLIPLVRNIPLAWGVSFTLTLITLIFIVALSKIFMHTKLLKKVINNEGLQND